MDLLMFQTPDRDSFVITGLLLATTAVLIAWAPSLLVRYFIFKEAVPWWAGALIAFLTLLLGMGVGIMLTGKERPAIHATAAIFAYLTVTKRGRAKEAEG